MFRTADIALYKLCSLRLLRGSILVEYQAKVVYRHEIVGGVAATAKWCLTVRGQCLK